MFKLNHYGNLSLNIAPIALFLFVIFNIFPLQNVQAQAPMTEYISPTLKTVQFHRQGWPFSYPLIRLNSEQVLQLSFDEPGSSTISYHYTIIHCDANWEPSPLMPTDYIGGNPIQPITDYQYSFNTTFDYVHYRLTFPNASIRPLRSGNYMLLVFEDFDQENPVLTKQFMVHEPQVQIIPHIRNTAQSAIRGSHQEINFEIDHKGFTIHNPNEEVSVTLMQNGRTDNKITGLKPQFFGGDKMDFNYTRETIMEGGNEFRYLDIRSTRFYSDRVEHIELVDPFFHVSTVPDFPRTPSSYQYRQDLNGRYYIEVDDKDNDELEADYLFVHFRLMVDRPQPSQKIFLNGALTNWALNRQSEMTYDADNNAYRLSLLLKQGYYNYQFLVVEQGETAGQLFPMENSFHETENDYLILVYYKNFNERSHRLIGAQLVNSVRRDE
jgi:hypothetical protein